MNAPASTPPAPARLSFQDELAMYWRQLPGKGLFFTLLAAWVLMFQFFGNSTLGLATTRSLFGWLEWMYVNSAGDDDHGRLIPFAVLALCWWKRDELIAVPKRHWWPGLALLALALALHAGGYIIQQTQVCAVAFFLGVYALVGTAWGPRMLAASFFPMCLLAFSVPMANVGKVITVPLRVIATHITTGLCQAVLGIHVMQQGTQILDSLGRYHYEVAAACSGMRSLTATLALALIYAFMNLKNPWRRGVVIASALPLAILANVFRLSTIIVAAEAFGQEAGNQVHSSSWFSLAPYVPAIIGILAVGWMLREDRPKPAGPLPEDAAPLLKEASE